jgi:N-acetylneuraminic acid mutarotase
MKNRLTILLLSLWLCSIASAQWTQRASYPYPVYSPFSFAIGDRVFVGCGLDSNFAGLVNDVFEYIPTSDTWVQRNDFPGLARYGSRAFTLNGFGYVSCGWHMHNNDWPLSDIWKYDPVNDSWTEVSSLPAGARYTAAAVSAAGKGYVGLGFAPVMNDWWEYDPDLDSWSSKPSFPGVPRQNPINFSYGGSVYVGGGGASWSPAFDFYRYDPGTSQWTQLADVPGWNKDATYTFVQGDSVYVACGFNQHMSTMMIDSSLYQFLADSSLSEVWRYEPLIDTWTQLSDFPGNCRYEGASCSLGNSAYMGMGFNVEASYASDQWWRWGKGTTGHTEVLEQSAEAHDLTAVVSGDRLIVRWSSHGSANVELMDMVGRVVQQGVVAGGSNGTEMDLSGLSTGTYVVRVFSGEKKRAIKVALLR